MSGVGESREMTGPQPRRRKAPAFATRMTRWTVQTLGLFHRAVTLGVRVAVFDDGGRILMVRHSYLPGWYLPGGGVDPGETAPHAAVRELKEETGLVARADPLLFGFYYNPGGSGRDHVVLYRIGTWEATAMALRPTREIKAAAFIDPHNLPDDVSPATQRRVAELMGLRPIDSVW